MSSSSLEILAKIARLVLIVVAALVVANLFLGLLQNPFLEYFSLIGTLTTLVVVGAVYWLVGKAETAYQRHEENRQERLRGFVDTYRRISMNDLAGKLNLSPQQTEEMIVRMNASGTMNARIENGYVISSSANAEESRFCTNCGKPLIHVNGKWVVRIVQTRATR